MATPNLSFGAGSMTGTAQTAPGFLFGNPVTAQPSTVATLFQIAFIFLYPGSGFGTPSMSSVASQPSFSFGSNTLTQSTAAFGATPFSTNPAPVSSGTGSLFGTTTTPAQKPFLIAPQTNFAPFGKSTPGAQGPDATQQQGMAGQPDPSLALHLAICTPSYFNNENDEVLRKWNQLQAFWGAGKGYYAPNMPPVEFTPENPYCRFKVVCYARIPSYHNEDGIVQIVIGKSLADLKPLEQNFVSTLNGIFGVAEVVISEMFAAELPDRTNIRLYVQQTLANGEKERATATDVARHMSQPTYTQTLKNLFVLEVLPLVNLTEAQLKEYLDTPQRGIDPALWEQGKRENPDPQKFLPVVKVGFQELQKQFNLQEDHAKKLQASMNNIMDEITQLRHKQTMMKAAIQDAKWKQANLTRRVLKLVSAQEVERKRGVPLDQTEEQIRMRLEDLYMQLMQPTQYRGCLNELMAQMCVKPASSQGGPRYGLVGDMEREVSQYMAWQHDALQAVVGVLKEDLTVVDSMMEEIQCKP
ncbi:nucleoporin p54-like isoform X6 [Scylla paramamosain]|uniref:nucleoporin p54-like isoform X6 n=1 Tax=Scylla paramamosain TaxID=85552 RepID=UPI0030831F10